MRQTILLEYSISGQHKDQGEGCRGPQPRREQTIGKQNFSQNLRNVENHFQWAAVHSRGFLSIPRSRNVASIVPVVGPCNMEPLGIVAKFRPLRTSHKQSRNRLSAETSQRPFAGPSIHAPSRANRTRMPTWNPGGMAQGSLVELRHWLRSHPYDIVILPETRWGFSRCWEDDAWSYLHSTTGTPRVGGLLVMISRQFLAPEHIGYEEVIPGRVLHVRLHFSQTALDLLAVYQYADDSTVPTQQMRLKLWNKLDEYIYVLPSRNQLVCCGDFNCALEAAAPWATNAGDIIIETCRDSCNSFRDIHCWRQTPGLQQ